MTNKLLGRFNDFLKHRDLSAGGSLSLLLKESFTILIIVYAYIMLNIKVFHLLCQVMMRRCVKMSPITHHLLLKNNMLKMIVKNSIYLC